MTVKLVARFLLIMAAAVLINSKDGKTNPNITIIKKDKVKVYRADVDGIKFVGNVNLDDGTADKVNTDATSTKAGGSKDAKPAVFSKDGKAESSEDRKPVVLKDRKASNSNDGKDENLKEGKTADSKKSKEAGHKKIKESSSKTGKDSDYNNKKDASVNDGKEVNAADSKDNEASSSQKPKKTRSEDDKSSGPKIGKDAELKDGTGAGLKNGENNGLTPDEATNTKDDTEHKTESDVEDTQNDNLADDLSDEVFVVKLTHGGQIRGSISRRNRGRLMRSFQGIPYAEPPVGELRFKPPVPKAGWGKEILDATDYKRMCVQIDDETAGVLVGDEDCLFLNVYTPELSNDTHNPKLAVMVFFHGGGFVFGDGGLYGPGRLLDEDIVLVTCNYRIGPLGFLSTSDENSPGNYGLMDQALVLQWVNENIKLFGGDTKRITIFGEGSGAASVIYHILSPMSAGLFQNAIAMSGTALSPWAFQEDPLTWALRLAADCNCSTDSNKEAIDCLRYNTTADTIVQLSNQFMIWGNLPYLYVPSLDGAFIVEHPRKTITSQSTLPKNIRLMTGINKDAGILYYMGIYQRLGDTVERFLSSRENMEFIVNYLLDDKKEADEAAKLVVDKYFASVDLKDLAETRNALIKTISHAMFEMWHYETALLLEKNHGIQTFVYSFDYNVSENFARIFEFEDLKGGVSQGDELFLLFDGLLFGDYDLTEEDAKMVAVIRTLWTNFAKRTDPTPKKSDLLPLIWKPSRRGKINVYHINDTPSMTTFKPATDELYKFWTEEVLQALPHIAIKKERRDEL